MSLLTAQHLLLFKRSNSFFLLWLWAKPLIYIDNMNIDFCFVLWVFPWINRRRQVSGHQRGAGDPPAVRERVQLFGVTLWLNQHRAVRHEQPTNAQADWINQQVNLFSTRTCWELRVELLQNHWRDTGVLSSKQKNQSKLRLFWRKISKSKRA